MKKHLHSIIVVLPILFLSIFVYGQSYPAKMQNNIAQFKPVKQSSTASEHRAGAHRAVDGNTDGNWNGLSVTHTGLEVNPWLEIDLLDKYEITEITIYNRTDCCMDRLNNFTIMVSDNSMEGSGQGELFVHEKGQIGKSKKYNGSITGRYVRIRLEGNNNNVLNLAEIVVNGNLMKRLPRRNNNVALGKPARQSSNYDGWAVANLANDGNTEGNWYLGSVATTNNEFGAWWEVDLGDVYQVSEVVIYNRTDCCPERLSDFVIKYSEKPFKDLGDGNVLYNGKNYPRGYLKCTPSNNTGVVNARFIRVALNGTNILSLAEVQVRGTMPGKVVEFSDRINDYYWTYERREHTGGQEVTQKTTFTNSVEKSAGYQLEEAFSRENQISIESSTSIGVTIKGVLDVSTSLTVGSSLSLSNSQTNSSNLSKAIKAESSDEINIPPASVVYYFTKWKERKNKVVVAYDGINWPYTATTDIKPAGDAVTMIYWKNDEIAPGLKTYASGEPIPEEVFQEIHAYHAAYYDQKDKPGSVVTGTTGTTNTTNLPPTSGNTASANNTSVVKCTDRNGQLVGYFMKLEDGSNNWVEKDTDGHIKFTYQETGKEDHAIHLYDSGRDVDICLQLNLGEVLYSDANNTTPFSIFTISEAY